MNILIIGAGWYGCHIAKILIQRGIEVTVIDKTNKIFSGSSYKNQNRLHLGFHYPRSKNTIIECKKGYSKFMENYMQLTETVENNLYFISSTNSHIGNETYIDTMASYDISFNIYNGELPLEIVNVEKKIIKVSERYINPFKSKLYFNDIIIPHFKVIENCDVFKSINNILLHMNDSYDMIINCTYNLLNPIDFEHYELFVTLLYKIETPSIFAYTLMDGPFFSIYPYDISNNIYTVTSVNNGIIYKGKKCEYIVSETEISNIKRKMELQISEYIPWWKNYSYISYYTSWKTKHDIISDDRSVKYTYEDNILNIYGGKITGIFEAENIVLSLLK
jgi:hypothetical protein